MRYPCPDITSAPVSYERIAPHVMEFPGVPDEHAQEVRGMSRTDGAVAGTVTEVVLAERILHDGEVVILTVKPSGWFVLLCSLPVLVPLAVVAAGTFFIQCTLGYFSETVGLMVLLGCSAAGGGQLLLASFRWLGRLYVLTNLRVLRLRGVVRVDVYECPLKRIDEVDVQCASFERIFALGSIAFAIDGKVTTEPGWINIARPHEVAEEVRRAIRRSHEGPRV